MSKEQEYIAKAIVDWARRGAKEAVVSHGKMCSTCAFRPGTEANNDPIVIEAAECVFGLNVFMCHERNGEKCVGFLNARELE